MATRILSRSVLSKIHHSISASSPFAPLRLRSLSAIALHLGGRLPDVEAGNRSFATRSTSSSLNDPNPNWSNRPPKETILLDGCDFEHWLVVMEKPEGDPTRDEIIDSYIKTLATVVGSEEEARMKIYSVSTKHYFAFGALVSEELSYKLKELPKVRWVLPDSYLDVKNKDYGGEPFINGQAVPYDPKYHEEWVRNNARAQDRNRRNDRPRNFDRSRNFERRRENMQNRDVENRGPPPSNMPSPNTSPGNFPSHNVPQNNMPRDNYSAQPPQGNLPQNSFPPQNNYPPQLQRNYAPPPQSNYPPTPQNNYPPPPQGNYPPPPPQGNYPPPPQNNYPPPPPQGNYPPPPQNNYPPRNSYAPQNNGGHFPQPGVTTSAPQNTHSFPPQNNMMPPQFNAGSTPSNDAGPLANSVPDWNSQNLGPGRT